MIDYEQILTELREEKAACQYAYGEMVPVFYVQALRKAIKDIMIAGTAQQRPNGWRGRCSRYDAE